MNPEEVEKLIRDALPGAEVSVVSDDNVHFDARVVSGDFEGVPTVARHRKVYAALGGRMGGDIHALALKTLAPSEADGGR